MKNFLKGGGMRKGYSLLVGLTLVDPKAYRDWNGVNGCWGCELDVDNVNHILKNQGYDIKTLKTAQATQENILNELDEAARKCIPGDIFIFYYTGHGGQQPDQNKDEMDGHDETLCAYNGEIIDDELNKRWLKFRHNVRIVMISDSCNSGTNYKYIRDVTTRTPINPLADQQISSQMRAQMIHMGGCRDSSSSAGYQSGSVFTIVLCNVWKGGDFQGNYRSFYEEIKKSIKGQIPQYNEYGPVKEEFRNQNPFTI